MNNHDFKVGDQVRWVRCEQGLPTAFTGYRIIRKIECDQIWIEGVAGWFSPVELMRRVNWREPLELSDGTPVTYMGASGEHIVLVRIGASPSASALRQCGLRAGVTTGARRKGDDQGMLTCNHAFYVRNRPMNTSFYVGQRVRYSSLPGINLTIVEISNQIVTETPDGRCRKRFTLEGRGIGHELYPSEGSDSGSRIMPYTPEVTKRTMFTLLGYHGMVFPTLKEASAAYHGSSVADKAIMQLEQQADGEGALFRTVNISGPVEPLPRVTVLYIRMPENGVLGVTDSLHTHCNPRIGADFGDNLRLTYENGKLVGAEVLP